MMAQQVDVSMHEEYRLSEALVSRRARDAIMSKTESYEFCDTFSFAVGLTLRELKAELAKAAEKMEMKAHALDAVSMIWDGEAVLAEMALSQKPKYCSVRVRAWGRTMADHQRFEEDLKERFKGKKLEGQLFGLRWAYMGGRGLDETYMEEIFDDQLLEEAYPALAEHGGMEAFIEAYLKSDETILILQGPPGGGKTRLIRKILATMSQKAVKSGADQYDTKASALYTGDAKTLEGDEIFASFITGEERAFVVEDADHMLKPRADGNDGLHRFLAVADGVVRAGGRKVIFSTNLPNVSDIDEALARPGRCFARVMFKELTLEQAVKLGERLGARLGDELAATGKKSWSVATVYQMAGKSKEAS